MSAAITCASCNRPLRVPESILGQTVQCPLCLDEFIARSDPAAEAAARAAEPRRAARPQPVAAGRAEREPEPPPLAQIIQEGPIEAVPALEAVPEPPAAPRGGPRRAVVFPVIVLRDPDRILRGPMDGELTAEGLYLRKPRQSPAFAAVGARARYLGTNRLVVTVEGREVELAVSKPWASTHHLARDTAAFLSGKGPFPNGQAYNLPWYLFVLPFLFVALPFTAAPFGLITDGPLGVFLWIVVALALGGITLAVVLQAWLRPRARLVAGLSMLGVGALLPLLAIPLTPTYTVDPALWTPFTPSSGEFTVLMPGAPGKAGAPAGMDNVTKKYSVDITNPEIRFTVYVAPAPQVNNFVNNPSVSEQAVTDAKNLLAREFFLNSSYPDTERSGGLKGQLYRDLYYQVPARGYSSGPFAGKSVAARVYVVNGKVFTLMAMGPRVRLDGSDVVKFFNSIQFPPIPPKPPPLPVKETTSAGKVVGALWNQLTVQTDVPGGNQQMVLVPDDARVTIDGQEAQVQNIKINSAVTITERDGKVVKVDAMSPAPFPPPPPPADFGRTFSGRIIRTQGRFLTVADDNFRQKVYFIANSAPITIDGIDANVEDLRAGQNVDVTTGAGNNVILRIEIKTK